MCGQGLDEFFACIQYEYSATGCVEGCQCPNGLFATDDNRCITAEVCNQGKINVLDWLIIINISDFIHFCLVPIFSYRPEIN